MLNIRLIILFIALLATSNIFGSSELAQAIKDGDLKSLESILQESPEALNQEIKFAGFPLAYAVSGLKTDVVSFLLQNGAEINAIDPKTKENAVFRLLDSTQTEKNLKKAIQIIGLLKEHKADFNIINDDNMTALYAFATADLTSKTLDAKLLFLETLVKAGARMDIKLKRDEPLLNAVLMKVTCSEPNHINVAKLLIELGAPVNQKSNKDAECANRNTVTENDTPLLIVMKREGFQKENKVEMIKLLVENGARTTCKNKKRENPRRLLDRKDPFYKEYYNALRKTKVKRRH